MKTTIRAALIVGAFLECTYGQIVTNPLQHALNVGFNDTTNHGSIAYRISADLSGDGQADQLITFETWTERYSQYWTVYRGTTNGYVDLKQGASFSQFQFILETNGGPRIYWALPRNSRELELVQVSFTNGVVQETMLGITTNDLPPSDPTLSNLFDRVLNHPDTNLVEKIAL